VATVNERLDALDRIKAQDEALFEDLKRLNDSLDELLARLRLEYGSKPPRHLQAVSQRDDDGA
jgi:hypothetical protein